MREAHCLAETQGNHGHSRNDPARLKKCQLTGGGVGDDAIGPGGGDCIFCSRTACLAAAKAASESTPWSCSCASLLSCEIHDVWSSAAAGGYWAAAGWAAGAVGWAGAAGAEPAGVTDCWPAGLTPS